jgi:hypothetical protein
LLNRERNLAVRLPYYIIAKLGTLSLFCAVQCLLFVAVGNNILEVKGMLFPYWYFMFITALSGLALGLLISSLATSSKMAANFVPLVLIPQLIFSGALVKYEEMNRDPDLLYSLQRWFVQNPDPKNPDASAREAAERKLRIPAVSRLVATHYTYEALIVAQAKLNPLTRRQDALQEEIDRLAKHKTRTAEENKRLEDLKQALIEVSVLHSDSGGDLDRRMRNADRVVRGASLQESGLNSGGPRLTATRRYTNQKVSEMVYKAETEQNDYRLDRKVNVFFSPDKYLWGIKVSVYLWNSAVLLLSSTALLTLLNFILSRQLRPAGKSALDS